MMNFYRRPQTANGWHLLTGDLASIKALTDAVGFHFAYDVAHQPVRARQRHSDSDAGRPSCRATSTAWNTRPKDIRLGLIEAAQNKIGTPVDQVLLFCYHYDPTIGKYTPIAFGALRVAGGRDHPSVRGILFHQFPARCRGSAP